SSSRARATRTPLLCAASALRRTARSARSCRVSNAKSGSPVFTDCPTETKIWLTTPLKGVPIAMFSLLASTRPTAATVLEKSETGGGAGGLVLWRCGVVRATEYAAHRADRMPMIGRRKRFIEQPPWETTRLLRRAIRWVGGLRRSVRHPCERSTARHGRPESRE